MTLTDLPAFAVHTITSGTEAEAVAHLQARGALVQARAPLLRMSSLHDLEHRRPLEIEETLGYVVTQAATVGLAVESMEMLGIRPLQPALRPAYPDTIA